MATKACIPDWAEAGGECRYGQTSGFLLGTWTWPNEGVTAVHYVAAFYSLMPCLLLCFIALAFLWTRGLREILAFIYQFLCVWVMYGLKLLFQQKRPEGSCLTSCGMPSGHTLQSIGTFTWLAIEVGRARIYEPKQKALILGVAGLFLLPVGWSRVVFNDHSVEQVWAGAAFGAVVAFLWYGLLQLRVTMWVLKLLKSWIPMLDLNYPLDAAPEEPWAPAAAAKAASYGATRDPEGTSSQQLTAQ